MTRLDRIVAATPDVIDADAGEVMIHDVEHDSRKVEPGVMFACVAGATVDGHRFARDAVRAGAAALLVERRLDLEVPQVIVGSVRRALGPVSSLVHGVPSRDLDVLGVTGTNGKTTTVRLLSAMTEELGGAATEIGTLTGERTTPEAPELQRILAESRDRGHGTVAMEVSSHALDQHRVDGTRFRVAGFTNLGVDHLDHHGDLEAYFEAKARLFEPDRTAFAVVDTSTDGGRRLADRLEIPHVLIGSEELVRREATTAGSRFLWRGLDVLLPLVGTFNVSNAVLAAEMLVALGHRPDAIAAAMERVDGVPGRFEVIDEGQPFAVVVDYAHTPDGLEAVLATARSVTRGRLWVVFGAGGDRDRSKRPQMGEVARRMADQVLVTSDNPRDEAPEAIIAEIVAGMDGRPDMVEIDRGAAIAAAIGSAGEGDVVVIAGKGHEVTQTIGDAVTAFDDREVTRDALRSLGSYGA